MSISLSLSRIVETEFFDIEVVVAKLGSVLMGLAVGTNGQPWNAP